MQTLEGLHKLLEQWFENLHKDDIEKLKEIIKLIEDLNEEKKDNNIPDYVECGCYDDYEGGNTCIFHRLENYFL